MNGNFSRKLRETGVVGAGGAGFPAYVKASAKADVVIMNAAECEPLLHKDLELLERHCETVLAGMQMMMASVGAGAGIIGIKKKHPHAIKLLEAALSKTRGIRLCVLGDFYPAGDEYCLVYETTGKLIPPGGIPLDVGAVVNNVETFYNMALGGPVTHTFITVCGAVKTPATFRLPVGVSFAEAIELAGGAVVPEPAAIDGGPMMGKIVTDFSEPVTKTTAGIIVLPKKHPLVLRKAAGRPVYSRIGKSACDQCSYCTMLCPRYLLGYRVEPHKVMRGLVFSGSERKIPDEAGLLCCECSLCSLYSCPENLDPRNMCVSAKSDLREKGLGLKTASEFYKKNSGVHAVREYRKTPVSRLTRRLGLSAYEKEAPLSGTDYSPKKVKLLLSQHVGIPASPVVSEGEKVALGQKIADVPPEKLGVPVHASIAGTVTKITQTYILIEARP